MRIRYAFLLAISAIALASCNFTLAADITPPPGYVLPTPMPTLGPLYPASAPDIENGAAIYAQKCAPCHGETGFGDGEKGKELPVTVAAFALPETARKASPAKWFTVVSQGNMDRFMPPFTSLSDQERWDVVAYALTLHTTPEQIEAGKSLYETNCAECHADGFTQEKMASLSAENIAFDITSGHADVPPMDMTEEDAYAVAAYMRTLTFAPPQLAAEPAAVTPTLAALSETPTPAETVTPSAEAMPLEGAAQAEVTPEATALAGFGTVSGVIENRTGAALPSDLKVVLRGYDHGAEPSAGPQEVLTLEGVVEADGSYKFENVEIPENRIFIAEATVDGITYQSGFAVAEAGAVEVSLPSFAVYAASDDYSVLTIDSLQIFFDFANEDNVQAFAVYSIINPTDKTVIVNMGDSQVIPFVTFPRDAVGTGYEATQDSAAFLSTPNGFAMPPSAAPYGLVAFGSLPKENKIQYSLDVKLNVANLVVFLPEGVKAAGENLADHGVQTIQNANFHIYQGGPRNAGDTVTFTISGRPKSSGGAASLTQNQSLLIGIGAFGVVLILAGVWLYLRDKNRREEETEDADEFEDAESILDAIIALDDLHRAGKLNDEAYHKRREELKARLK